MKSSLLPTPVWQYFGRIFVFSFDMLFSEDYFSMLWMTGQFASIVHIDVHFSGEQETLPYTPHYQWQDGSGAERKKIFMYYFYGMYFHK